MTIENFPHLDGNIDAKKILDIPIQLVDDKHLGKLSNHLNNIQEKFKLNLEVVDAAELLKEKINTIVFLGQTRKSGEIMKAANDPDYLIKEAV